MGAIVPGTKSVVALGVSGRTASGKSTCIRGMKSVPGAHAISFGRYVASQAEARNLSVDRQTLQTLGEELVKADPEAFLQGTLEANPPPAEPAQLIIFDGIRHDAIWEVIRVRYIRAITVGLDCPKELCRSRLIERDHLSIEDADAILRHPMELSAEQFVTDATIRLRTDVLSLVEAEEAGRSIANLFIRQS